jgi:hypothetical protein
MGGRFQATHRDVHDADRHLTLLSSWRASGAMLGLGARQNEKSTRCGPDLNVALLTQAGCRRPVGTPQVWHG